MHYYKSSNEIMQYCFVSNDIALIMHYHALLKRSDSDASEQEQEDVLSGSTRVGSNLRIIRRYYSIYSNIRVCEFAY